MDAPKILHDTKMCTHRFWLKKWVERAPSWALIPAHGYARNPFGEWGLQKYYKAVHPLLLLSKQTQSDWFGRRKP